MAPGAGTGGEGRRRRPHWTPARKVVVLGGAAALALAASQGAAMLKPMSVKDKAAMSQVMSLVGQINEGLGHALQMKAMLEGGLEGLGAGLIAQVAGMSPGGSHWLVQAGIRTLATGELDWQGLTGGLLGEIGSQGWLKGTFLEEMGLSPGMLSGGMSLLAAGSLSPGSIAQMAGIQAQLAEGLSGLGLPAGLDQRLAGLATRMATGQPVSLDQEVLGITQVVAGQTVGQAMGVAEGLGLPPQMQGAVRGYLGCRVAGGSGCERTALGNVAVVGVMHMDLDAYGIPAGEQEAVRRTAMQAVLGADPVLLAASAAGDGALRSATSLMRGLGLPQEVSQALGNAMVSVRAGQRLSAADLGAGLIDPGLVAEEVRQSLAGQGLDPGERGAGGGAGAVPPGGRQQLPGRGNRSGGADPAPGGGDAGADAAGGAGGGDGPQQRHRHAHDHRQRAHGPGHGGGRAGGARARGERGGGAAGAAGGGAGGGGPDGRRDPAGAGGGGPEGQTGDAGRAGAPDVVAGGGR